MTISTAATIGIDTVTIQKAVWDSTPGIPPRCPRLCQGRRETRPKGGARHCHRGWGDEVAVSPPRHRRGDAGELRLVSRGLDLGAADRVQREAGVVFRRLAIEFATHEAAHRLGHERRIVCDAVVLVAVKMRGYLANSPRELTVPVEANQR